MEKNAPKFNLNKKLLAIAGGAVAVVGLAAVLLWPGNIHEELTVEAGRTGITANDFRKEDKGVDAQFVSDMTVVDLKTPGSYPVSVEYKGKTYACTLTVEDTIPPEAEIRNVSIYSGHELKAEDFVVSVNDATVSGRAPCRHWKIALCSLSTGISVGPSSVSAQAAITIFPPATSASLLASSTCSQTSSAAQTASRPAMPTMAHSAS